MVVLNFILAHQVIFAGVGVAVIDLLIGLNPNLAGSNLLHQVYLFLKGKSGPQV